LVSVKLTEGLAGTITSTRLVENHVVMVEMVGQHRLVVKLMEQVEEVAT
jgi:hypothetical protein